VLEAENGPEQMRRMGQRLRDGIAAQALRHGVGVRQSGPPQMPTILFDDDTDCAKGSRFVLEALHRGVYLHPKHNMFLSLAHTVADIDHALSVTDQAFKVVAGL
jgi:glutamate-1-semialdehyde 2,1-aminomutase